jgi:ribonuclease HI
MHSYSKQRINACLTNISRCYSSIPSIKFNFSTSNSNKIFNRSYCSSRSPNISNSISISNIDISSSSLWNLKLVKKYWTLQFDGGSRGNPGFGGSGSVIFENIDMIDPVVKNNRDDNINYDEGNESNLMKYSKEIWSGYHYLGDNITNNVAEYNGLIEGLRSAVSMEITSLRIEGDSELIIKQILGLNKVKNLRLITLHKKVIKLLENIPSYEIRHIRRHLNIRADELANIAMDKKLSSNL